MNENKLLVISLVSIGALITFGVTEYNYFQNQEKKMMIEAGYDQIMESGKVIWQKRSP